MSFDNASGINVYNHYGARATGGAIGNESTKGSLATYTVHLTGEHLNSNYVSPVVIPKGALLAKATLVVDEVFVVSAAGTVAIGGTAPGTNGVVLTEAKLEALGSSDVTSLAIGTWASSSTTGTSAAQKVAKAITGTVAATQGKAQLIMEFVVRDKV